jgi:diguanylate cyclase (GGDEF)-like protein
VISIFSAFPKELMRPEVLIWMLPCVLVSVGIGVVLGRGIALRHITIKLHDERQRVVRSLQKLLESTEQLSLDVGTHKSELADVERTVSDLPLDAGFEVVQAVLLTHIGAVVQSHKRLEDDLVVTRYQLQEQAVELDRTRVEARTDKLSGLANRQAFDEALQFVMASYHRRGMMFALVLADVDHFKRVNDTHGHDAGDRVVSRIGDVMQEHCRAHDIISRFGGDEFAVIFTKVTQEQALIATKRLRTAIEQTNFDVGADGAKIAVTFSMGLAYPQPDDTLESIFKRADDALYRAKHTGRNRLCGLKGVATSQSPESWDNYREEEPTDRSDDRSQAKARVQTEAPLPSA